MEPTRVEISKETTYADLIGMMGFPKSLNWKTKKIEPRHGIDVTVLPSIEVSNVLVHWHNIGQYIMTIEAVYALHYAGFRPATPAEFMSAIIKMKSIETSLACLFEVDGPGQNRSGFGAMTAHGGLQRSASTFVCGDGFGAHCLFGVVPVGA